MSLQAIISDIEQLDGLELPLRAAGLAQLISSTHEANISASGSAAGRVLVQGTFCQTLLKSLRPTKSAADVQQAVNSQHNSHTTPPPAAGENDSLAQAWAAASTALELLYSWEDEEVVVSIINFWREVSSLLSGAWLHPAAHDQLTQQGAAAASTSPPQANSQAPAGASPSSQQPTTTSELQYLSWLWSLSPTAVAAVVQQLHQFTALTGINPLQQHPQHKPGPYVNLLLLFLHLHHLSSSISTSSSVNPASMQPALCLLQLLHGGAGQHSPWSVAAALTAGEAFSGVCCLLQAAAVVRATVPGNAAQPSAAAAATPAAAQPAGGDISDAVTTTAPAPAAAAAVPVWPRLAEAAGSWLRELYGWCGFGEAANSSAAAAAAAAESARHAAAAFSNSMAAAATVPRPSSVESLYDCFVMHLLQQMVQGSAHATNSSSSSSAGQRVSTASQQDTLEAAAAQHPSPLCDAPSALDADAWEGWLGSEGFGVLAALAASYDRPEVLARGLHVLTQQQLMAAEHSTAPPAADAVAGAAASQASKAAAAAARKADKAAMGRVLELLERVFLWRQRLPEEPGGDTQAGSDSSSRALAGGVRQLLLALAELLRPAANCSVEWRCAVLAAMLSAVEDFMQQRPDASDLEQLLWCDASVEGLLYCASHDPSIQARRAAVQLLQHVVLPNSSPTARALIGCLSDKLSDKDSGVAAAALQLFVQLEPQVICNCLTAAQWCSAVQAGLEVVCGGSSSNGGGAEAGTQTGRGSRGAKQQQGAAVVDAETRAKFSALLRKVLLATPSVGPQGQQGQGWGWLLTQGGRVVGVEGCRQVLLLLMLEHGLEDRFRQAVLGGV